MACRHMRADCELAGRSNTEEEGDIESMLAEFKTYLANRMERSMKEVAAMNQARAVCAERGFTGGWSTGMRIPATFGLCAN